MLRTETGEEQPGGRVIYRDGCKLTGAASVIVVGLDQISQSSFVLWNTTVQ